MSNMKNNGLMLVQVLLVISTCVFGQESFRCDLLSQLTEERENYDVIAQNKFPAIQALFGKEEGQYMGYNWTPYNVTTDDGWALTLFKFNSTCENPEDFKGDVLIIGDTFMDTEKMLYGYFIGKPMPLQLNDNCYNVWMGDNFLDQRLFFNDSTSQEIKCLPEFQSDVCSHQRYIGMAYFRHGS